LPATAPMPMMPMSPTPMKPLTKQTKNSPSLKSTNDQMSLKAAILNLSPLSC
jgi:hypothetical protein